MIFTVFPWSQWGWVTWSYLFVECIEHSKPKFTNSTIKRDLKNRNIENEYEDDNMIEIAPESSRSWWVLLCKRYLPLQRANKLSFK